MKTNLFETPIEELIKPYGEFKLMTPEEFKLYANLVFTLVKLEGELISNSPSEIEEDNNQEAANGIVNLLKHYRNVTIQLQDYPTIQALIGKDTIEPSDFERVLGN